LASVTVFVYRKDVTQSVYSSKTNTATFIHLPVNAVLESLNQSNSWKRVF